MMTRWPGAVTTTVAPLGGVPERVGGHATEPVASDGGAGWLWLLVVGLAVALAWQVWARRRDAATAATEWRAEHLRQNARDAGLTMVEAGPRSVTYAVDGRFSGVPDHIRAQHAIDWGVLPDQVEMAAVAPGLYALRVRDQAPGHGA